MGHSMTGKQQRRGAAIVELALFLPVYFLVAMGTIETCRALYIRQSLKIAAYECARVGIIPAPLCPTCSCNATLC